MQCGHFRVTSGMGIAHSGQSFVVAAAASGRWSRLTALTSRYTANAMMRNVTTLVMKSP